MNKKTKTTAYLIAFILFVAVAVLLYNTFGKRLAPQDHSSVSPNKEETSPIEQDEDKEKTKAPDFTVYDADGNTVKLSELFGKPIVLNFWASWCPPCKAEMPEFNRAYEENGEDIIFMMVDLVDGKRETKETGGKYIEEKGFSFPVYFDTEQDAAAKYGLVSIPTTIFIDRDGYIAAGVRGAVNAKALQEGIDLIK